MTISELQIQLDISSGNEIEVLKQYAHKTSHGGYIFVDSYDGQCYLFDKLGKIDDISKVERIGNRAFASCTSLESIIIPGFVKRIGNYAFYNCRSLESIVIPNSIKSIGNGAFYYCRSLESIVIPNSVKSIGGSAFYFCTSLESITISDSVENIGRWAFGDCTSLKEVIFKGKTISQVEAMDNYPWDIKDTSIIKYK